MKCIFDLRSEQDNSLVDRIQKLYNEPLVVIRYNDIKPCIGCWNCWLKTPGLCVMKDTMSEHYTDYVNSDTVIMLMDTAQGFIDYRAKAFIDRLIPLYHPHIIVVEGECHHAARYDSYPDMVFYYDNKDLTKAEDQLVEDYLYRVAFHFKSKPYRITNDNIELIPLQPRQARRGLIKWLSVEPIEKLVIYNGSPRIKEGNSTKILEKVKEVLGDKVEIRDLKQKDKWAEWATSFAKDTNVMFFMPLYVHAMPSHVMAFMRLLDKSEGSLSFFVQQGFPESSQSYYLEAYFEQLAIRLNRAYLGTAIKGGVEGLSMRPPVSQNQLILGMISCIERLVNQGHFNSKDIIKLGRPVRMNKVVAMFVRMGLVNKLFWDSILKKNNAINKSFDKPHQ